MYSTKKGENKNKMIKPVIKEININNIKDSDNTNKINRSELKQKILNISPNQLTENPIKIDKNNFRSFSINKNNSRKNFYQTNMSYSLRKFKKLKKNKKMSLPFIKPREIIIEYQLTNGSGANQDNKNLERSNLSNNRSSCFGHHNQSSGHTTSDLINYPNRRNSEFIHLHFDKYASETNKTRSRSKSTVISKSKNKKQKKHPKLMMIMKTTLLNLQTILFSNDYYKFSIDMKMRKSNSLNSLLPSPHCQIKAHKRQN